MADKTFGVIQLTCKVNIQLLSLICKCNVLKGIMTHVQFEMQELSVSSPLSVSQEGI